MSAKLMGECYDLDIPRPQRDVLQAMADHADHLGNNVFPSIGLIAWKTGADERTVTRIVSSLRKDGILVEMGETPGGVHIYRIEISHIPRKKPYEPKPNGRPMKTKNGVTKCQGVSAQEKNPLTKKPGGYFVTHNHHKFESRALQPNLNSPLPSARVGSNGKSKEESFNDCFLDDSDAIAPDEYPVALSAASRQMRGEERLRVLGGSEFTRRLT